MQGVRWCVVVVVCTVVAADLPLDLESNRCHLNFTSLSSNGINCICQIVVPLSELRYIVHTDGAPAVAWYVDAQCGSTHAGEE